MKSFTILGNWKSNKTIAQAKSWTRIFLQKLGTTPSNVRVMLCPAYHHLSIIHDMAPGLILGVQDISPYAAGPYTGEIAASQISDMAHFALLGHSERRANLGETDELVSRKVRQTINAGMKPVVCVGSVEEVRKLKEDVPGFNSVGMLLYEPTSAISTSGIGLAQSPQEAGAIAADLSEIMGGVAVLYGGSVNTGNIAGYLKEENLVGIVAGSASLDPGQFADLIQVAGTVSL